MTARRDARTLAFFAICFLVLTFGCKGGGHLLKAAGAVAGGTARVVAAAAAAGALSGPSRREGVEVAAVPVQRNSACLYTCPMVGADGRELLVCAQAAVAADPDSDEFRPVYVCPDQRVVAWR